MILILIVSLIAAGPTAVSAGDPYADIQAMRSAFAQIHSAIAIERFSSGGVATVAYSAPNRFRVTTPQSEIVLAGNVEYGRHNGGKWVETSQGAQHQVLLTAVWQLAGPPSVDLHKLFAITPIGTKTYRGAILRGYALHEVDGAYDETLWIAADNLPASAQISMPGQTVEIRYSDYNTGVLIATP